MTTSSISHDIASSLGFSDTTTVRILTYFWFNCVQLFVSPRTAVHQASLSFTIFRVCSNSCPLSQRCHSTISSSVASFSSYHQSFPASRSFPMSCLFYRIYKIVTIFINEIFTKVWILFARLLAQSFQHSAWQLTD